MKIPTRLVGVIALAVLLPACEIFENQAPETVSFRMDGGPGDVVRVIYSKRFIAGEDETGVTRLEIFEADTVEHQLPIDTIIDVRIERQLYLEAQPLAATDTIAVGVRIDVNDRGLFNDTGDLLPEIPWQFLYRFNARPTQDIEVVI